MSESLEIKIRAWLASDKPYVVGLILFIRIGGNNETLKILQSGQPCANLKLLTSELERSVGIIKPKVDVKKRPAVESDQPLSLEAFREAYKERNRLYARKSYLKKVLQPVDENEFEYLHTRIIYLNSKIRL